MVIERNVFFYSAILFLLNLFEKGLQLGMCLATSKEVGRICVKEGRDPHISLSQHKFDEFLKVSSVYVDKTTLIQRFLDMDAKVLLTTLPRRFGKSLNMDMIRLFLEVQVDPDGKTIEPESTFSHAFFKNGKIGADSVKEPMISESPAILNEYLVKWPVIALNFNELGCGGYSEMIDNFRTMIQNLFSRHMYLCDALLEVSKNESIKQTTRTLANGRADAFLRIISSKSLSISKLKGSLKFLASLMHAHFGKPAFILIDEFDVPWTGFIYDNSGKCTDVDAPKKTAFMRDLSRMTFRYNDHLKKAFITGVIRLSHEGIFTVLTELEEYNLLDGEYFPYYGFTVEEANALFEVFKIPDETQSYCSQRFDGYSTITEKHVYNPYALVNFIMKKRERSWTEVGNINFIKPLFRNAKIRSTVLLLLSNGSVVIPADLQLHFSLPDVKTVNDLVNGKYKPDKTGTQIVYKFLLAAGYLTPVKKVNSKICLKIPNLEVKEELKRNLKEFSENEKFGEYDDSLSKLGQEIFHLPERKNTTRLEEAFRSFLTSLPPFINMRKVLKNYDGIHGNEDIVHIFVASAVLKVPEVWSTLGSEFIFCYPKINLKGELTTAKPRMDIITIKNGRATIIEMKYDGSADEAVEQADINYTRFFDEYAAYDFVEEIHLIGVNVFPNKTVEVKDELIKRDDKDFERLVRRFINLNIRAKDFID